jgi:hypothetical protein
MPRRGRDGLSLAARFIAVAGFGGGLALLVTGCQGADVGDAGCQLTTQVVLPGTPLTLLADARLDPIGAGYVLIGSDTSSVRWAALDANGTMGAEQALPLPSGVSSPIYAVAGVNAPADSVLIGYLTPATNGVDADLRFIVAPADGSAPGVAGAPVLTLAGAANGPPPLMAFTSSRSGMAAGLAWADVASGQLFYAAVTGAGAFAGTPVSVDAQAGDLTCLLFGSGSGPFTLQYLHDSPAATSPIWVTVAADDGGSLTSRVTLSLPSGKHPTTCAVATPAGTGWALVWQDTSGSWLSSYSPSPTAGSGLVQSYGFAPATDFGGPDVQPPLVGLSPFGLDFGVLLARPRDVEMWRIDAMGNRHPGALVFPSLQDNFGEVSATPTADGKLAVTYADFTSSSATPATGRRLFVNAACY